MTNRPAADAARSPALGVVTGVCATAAGLALVGWASLDGREIAAVDPPSIAALHTSTAATTTPTPTGTATTRVVADHGVGIGLPTWVWEALLAAIALAAAAALVLLAVRVVRALRPAGRLEAPSGTGIDLVIGDEDARRQAGALEHGTPRNAVVACWSELERLVAAAGFPRRPSETSSELVVRVLADQDVPRGALTDLAALYREARFSRHELGEDHRDGAREALAAVHAALRSEPAPDAGVPR